MRWPNAWLTTGVNLPPMVPLEQFASKGEVSPDDIARSKMLSVTVAEPPQTGATLAIGAGQAALERAKVDPARIRAYLHAIPHWLDRGTFHNPAVEIAASLRLPRTARVANHVSMCDGMSALTWLLSSLLAEPESPVLLTTGATWSTGLKRLDTMPALAFGDAGAALVVTPERLDSRAQIVGTGTHYEPRLLGMHRPVRPEGSGPISFRERSDAFAEREGISDKARNDLIGHGVSEAAARALADAGITAQEVTDVVGSFLSPHLFDAEFARPLRKIGFEALQFAYSLDIGLEIGHTGPSDTIIGLHRLLPYLRPGFVVLIGSGAGYTWTVVVVRIY